MTTPPMGPNFLLSCCTVLCATKEIGTLPVCWDTTYTCLWKSGARSQKPESSGSVWKVGLYIRPTRHIPPLHRECTSALVLPVVCREWPPWQHPGSKISFHQVLTKGADGVSVKCAFSLQSPAPAPLPSVPTSSSPSATLSATASCARPFCNFIKAPDRPFTVEARKKEKNKTNNGSLAGVCFLKCMASSLRV